MSGESKCSDKVLRGHTEAVNVSLKGERIVSGSGDKTMRVWDAASGQCVLGPLENLENGQRKSVWGDYKRSVKSVCFSPDGERFVSGSLDNLVRVWDTNTGELLRTLRGHTYSVYSVSWHGECIVSGAIGTSTDDTVRVWDANTGECLKIFRGHEREVESVCFSPDGERIASGSVDRTIRVWDANTGRCVLTLRGHTSVVRSVSWDGGRIVSGSSDKTVRVWDVSVINKWYALKRDIRSLFVAAFQAKGLTNQGFYVLYMKQYLESLEEVKAEADRIGFAVPEYEELKKKLVGTLPAANYTVNRNAQVSDANTGQRVLILRGHRKGIHSVSWHGKRIVSGSRDKTVRVWDANTGQCVLTLRGHTQGVRSVSWDGGRIVSGSIDTTVRVWDVSVINKWDALKRDIRSFSVAAEKAKGLTKQVRHIMNMRQYLESLEEVKAEADRRGFTVPEYEELKNMLDAKAYYTEKKTFKRLRL